MESARTSSITWTKLCTKILYILLQTSVLLLQIYYQKKSFLITPSNIENKFHSSLYSYTWDFTYSLHGSCELWNSFSQALIRNSYWCYTYNYLHLWLLKRVENNAIGFKLFWYSIFVQLKLILLDFLMDSVSKLYKGELERNIHVDEPNGGKTGED